MSSTPNPIDVLNQKAAASTQAVQSDAPVQDDSKTALVKAVADISSDAQAPEANAMTPRSMRYQISAAQSPQTPAPVQASPVTSSLSQASPFNDVARPLIEAAGLPTNVAADIWDNYYQAPDAAALAKSLAPLVVPNDLKNKLWQAKVASTPALGPVDKVTAAIQKMATIPPDVLAIAEKYPSVLKSLTSVKE